MVKYYLLEDGGARDIQAWDECGLADRDLQARDNDGLTPIMHAAIHQPLTKWKKVATNINILMYLREREDTSRLEKINASELAAAVHLIYYPTNPEYLDDINCWPPFISSFEPEQIQTMPMSMATYRTLLSGQEESCMGLLESEQINLKACLYCLDAGFHLGITIERPGS